MPRFKLEEPFGVDNGELDGLALNLVFTLGVEWEMFRTKFGKCKGSFSFVVHTQNEKRLRAMVERGGRISSIRKIDESWVEIRVSDEVVN